MALEIDYDGLLGAGMIVSDGVVIGSVVQRGGGDPYRVELLFTGPGGDVVELFRALPEVRAFAAGFLAAARRGAAQAALPPLVDRAELVGLLEDLASVNLSREAVERQARRMADDLIARGLSLPSATRETGNTPEERS